MRDWMVEMAVLGVLLGVLIFALGRAGGKPVYANSPGVMDPVAEDGSCTLYKVTISGRMESAYFVHCRNGVVKL